MRNRERQWINHQKLIRKWRNYNKMQWNVEYTHFWCPQCKTYEYFIRDHPSDPTIRHCECLPF